MKSIFPSRSLCGKLSFKIVNSDPSSFHFLVLSEFFTCSKSIVGILQIFILHVSGGHWTVHPTDKNSVLGSTWIQGGLSIWFVLHVQEEDETIWWILSAINIMIYFIYHQDPQAKMMIHLLIRWHRIFFNSLYQLKTIK